MEKMSMHERQEQFVKQDDHVIESNLWKRFWHDFCKRKINLLGLFIVVVYIILAIFAEKIAPYDPIEMDLSKMLATPSAEHIMGCDELGRDIFSRVLYGATISIKVGFLAIAVGFAIGAPLGIISGYMGKTVDMLIMRAMDILMSFPGMLLAIMFVSVLGQDLNNAIIAVGIATVPNFARLARGETLAIKNSEYIEAARALGATDFRIVFNHVFNNVISPLIIMCATSFGNAIITTAGLGFLGIGAQPPTPKWGAMLSNGRQFIMLASHITTMPGLAMFGLVLGLNLLGDGIRDVLDPKLRD